ncbi:cell wall hydrolase [Clostridium tunisiense]|uniref:cell wall hydrolase n=1 Tax=Clostridium tunisiense TaxID=219748 RepID=UPI000312DE7E|nr:cell wall hydrolase [Clostridium tunisiense]
MFKMNNFRKILIGATIILFTASGSAKAATHEVQKGDTLYKISKSYGVTLDSLRETNNKWDNLIIPGEVLEIPGETSSTDVHKSEASGVIPYTEEELQLLGRLIRAEAENQPYTAKIAVGAVVVNRVKSDKFPNNITSVIYEKRQFTPVSNGMINKPATEETLKAAKEALGGNDPTNGALFFFDTSATSSWLRSKPQALKVDKMVFAF